MKVAEKLALERIADALESIAGNGDREAASPDFGTMSGPTDAHAGGAARTTAEDTAVEPPDVVAWRKRRSGWTRGEWDLVESMPSLIPTPAGAEAIERQPLVLESAALAYGNARYNEGRTAGGLAQAAFYAQGAARQECTAPDELMRHSASASESGAVPLGGAGESQQGGQVGESGPTAIASAADPDKGQIAQALSCIAISLAALVDILEDDMEGEDDG